MPQVIVNEDGDKPKFAPVLWVFWDFKKDSLICKKDETVKISEPFTERKIFCVTHKIFDPIEFTAPVTLIPKLILQETWV